MTTHDIDTSRPRSDASVEAAHSAFLVAGDERRRDRAVALLSMEGGREFVLRSLRAAGRDERTKLWDVAIDESKALVAAHDPRWVATVVNWLGDGDAGWEEAAHFCAEVGFYATLYGMSRPLNAEAIREIDPTSPGGRATLYLHLMALRSAYRWEEMARCLLELRVDVANLDPYSKAFHVFGMLVSGHPDGEQEMARLLEVAGDNYRVHLALLEALRLSNNLTGPEQGRRMLELLDRPALRGSISPDPLYRRAFALRRIGDYEAALRAVDDCLARLPAQQVQDRVRIIQEHDLIMAERAIAEQRKAAEEAAEKALARHSEELRGLVDKEVEHARRSVSDALFRVVEVLGLFITIIALLGASVASAAAADLIWWQRGALILIATAVILAFFHTLRVVVRPDRRRDRRR